MGRTAIADEEEVHTLSLPLRTVSASNQREHWAVRAKRNAMERATVRSLWQVFKLRALLPGECADVTLTRVAPRLLDRHDNLSTSFKAVADQVTDCLGLPNDRDGRVTWGYKQRKGKPQEYAVVVEVRYSQAEAARPRGDKA